MRYGKSSMAALALAAWLTAGQSLADVSFGLSVGDEGVRSFYLAIGEHYEVSEKQIVLVQEKRIPDEDMPVVFFLARRAEVAPDIIVKLRLGGKSWMDICLHFGLSAEVFYVPVKHDPGPPYGKAYGHFKKRKRAQWAEIRLTDAEIVDFVNLKFVSEHYGFSADEVMKMRGTGSGFVDIHTKVKKQKKADESKQLSSSEEPEKKGAGKKNKRNKNE